MTEDDLLAEMLEFGMTLDVALRAAPMLLPLFNDPEGRIAMDVSRAAPLLASRLGLVQLH